MQDVSLTEIGSWHGSSAGGRRLRLISLSGEAARRSSAHYSLRVCLSSPALFVHRTAMSLTPPLLRGAGWSTCWSPNVTRLRL